MEKFWASAGITVLLFGALPATSNYKLNSYGFGSGGTAKSQTATYSLEGATGEFTGAPGSTVTGSTKPGYTQTQQANVPKLASLDNNGGQYYNKLRFIIDTQGNPSDAKYMLAVSTDNFATNTQYVQPDGTLTPTLTTANYQTYATWGGASGSLMIGLQPSTTYSVKLRATQGAFTESAYGPVVSQATAAPSLTFSLVTSSQPTPPFSVELGTLSSGSVATTAQTINTSLSTNGTTGANVYIAGKNGGLKSTATGYQINAVSSDLTSLSEGFGAQNSSVSQTSGGPYTVTSPYNGSGNIVGMIEASSRSLYTSSNPVTGGSGVLVLKAKSASMNVAATDYQEILTFVAAGNF
jgi:hypothetical protein